MIRVQGILSIIFGAMGAVGALFIFTIANLSTYLDPTFTDEDYIGVSIMTLLGFVFFFLPHVYLIISGSYLLKHPEPKTAKVLVIITTVIAAIWNLVILIFAIINLVQISDYARGYKKLRPAHHTPKAA